MIEVAVNNSQMKKLTRTLAGVRSGVPKVLSRAINKTAVAAKTKIVRTVAGEINVKQADIKKRNVKLKRASFRHWVATISIFGGRIPLVRFGARQTKKGVSYKIKKAGARKKIAGAFIATMPSGHKGVFKRKDDTRLPIGERFGPSVPAEMDNIHDLTRRVLDRQISKNLHREIKNQVGLILKKN